MLFIPAAHHLARELREDELLLVGVLGEEGRSGVGHDGETDRHVGHQQHDRRPDARLAGCGGGVLDLLGEIDRRLPAPVDEHAQQQSAGQRRAAAPEGGQPPDRRLDGIEGAGDVTGRKPAQKTFHHPHVGTITLTAQAMYLEGTPGQRLSESR
jgi:hypothetical protein